MEDDEVGGNGELTSETHKESHLPAAFSGVYTSAQVRDIFEIELDQDNSSDRDGASTILEETESISVGEVMKSPFFSENESSDNSFWIDLGHNPMGFDYASQQLKLCPLEFSKNASVLYMVSQILAWILFGGESTREIDACNGIVSAASDILMSFKPRNELGNEVLVPKCISALLFILDNLLQSRPRFSSETMEGNAMQKTNWILMPMRSNLIPPSRKY
ncbi:unnamed protein product, partial [Vitis vinifera]